ncbi:MAG: sugar phosphate isomerase/epimerase [Bryobacterales bacterium]|nr:sugar phosphate isomerase/epimerase [Bryobacterales bacterium]
MKIGIDSYCYHRFFGEVYPQQPPPPKRMTLEDFLERAHELGVEGVSLESCFFPDTSPAYLDGVRKQLEPWGVEPVYAWGHPDGLEGGTNPEAFRDMLDNFERAARIGARVMRVVGSSLRFRKQPHEPQIDRLVRLFRETVRTAEACGIRLAVENHIDFTSAEMASLLERVDSPWLGINFDTGNFLRLLDDPVKGMRTLAPRVYATHIKDLKVQRGVPADEWYFFSSTPVGDGLVDNAALFEMLAAVNYRGVLAVEMDFLHPDYGWDEDAAVARSVAELRRLRDACLLKAAPRSDPG